jgi:hypothetical protein
LAQKHRSVRIAFVVIGFLIASLGFASVANASLHRPFPNGINGSSAKSAWKQVSSRASVDPSYAGQIAKSAGVPSFDANDYKVVGYGKASSGTVNSGVTSGGSTVATSDTATCRVGATVLIVINKSTSKRIEVCTGCGNPRLRPNQPLVRQKWSVGTVLPFKQTKKVTRSCPSPFSHVKATVWITVKGKVRGRSWGTVVGKMNGRIRVRINATIAGRLQLVCPKPAPPAPPPVGCQAGFELVGGNCVNQSNNAEVRNDCEGPNKYSLQCVTIIVQINANCSKLVFGDGTIVFHDSDGNTVNETYCSVVNPPPPPPPPAPDESARCVDPLQLTKSSTSKLVTATAHYETENATFNGATFDWGDSSPVTTTSGNTATHTYANFGSYTVTAVLKFTTDSGKSITDTCFANVTFEQPDRPPQISVVWPPHIYEKGGSQAIWIEASDPDGDVIATPNIVASESTKQYAHVSSIVEVNVRWDGSPCPAQVKCFRGTLWGDMEGFVDLTATVTAGGKSASVSGRVQVYKDEF